MATTEERLEELLARLDVEVKIKDGAENLLKVFESGEGGSQPRSNEALRRQVERELEAANSRIASLCKEIEDLKVQSPLLSASHASASASASASESSLLAYNGVSPFGAPPSGSVHSSFFPPASNRQARTSDNSVAPPGNGLGIGLGEPADFDSVPIAGSTATALSQATSLLQALSSLAEEAQSLAATTATSEPASLSVPSAASSSSRPSPRARNAVGHARTPSHAMGLGETPRRRVELLSALIRVVKSNVRVRYELPVEDVLGCALPCLADGAGKECRASAYGLLRHSLIRPPWALVSAARHRGLDFYVARTLMRDSRFDAEREQALKLIRAIMEAGAGSDALHALSSTLPAPPLVTPAIIRALIACAEHTEDKLRHLCLETLAELALLDLPLLARGGGMRTLLHSLSSGPIELAPALAQLTLSLADRPRTRAYLTPGVDLETALSGFTDAPSTEGPAFHAALQRTCAVVLTLLRSWAGILYLCLDKRRAVGSLVLALRVQPVEVQETILDTLQELFGGSSVGSAASRPDSLHLIDHYLALLLAILAKTGLVEALAHLLESRPELTRKAARLMGTVCQLANRTLPSSYGVEMQALPGLFAQASSFHAPDRSLRAKATAALSAIDRSNGAHSEDPATALASTAAVQPPTLSLPLPPTPVTPTTPTTMAATAGPTTSASAAPTANAAPPVTPTTNGTSPAPRSTAATSRRLIPAVIDDTTFRNLLLETQVLATRDHTRWNNDLLIELLEGPLRNPRRMDEAARASKFGRRLLAFLQPFSLRYSALARLPSNARYTRLGCATLEALVATAEGVRFLTEGKLLRELRECLEQVLPSAGHAPGALFSPQRVRETLSGGYFEMIGVLTHSAEGLDLLSRSGIFDALYRLSDVHSRADLLQLAIEGFDYAIQSHCRVLLAKALTSAYRPLRLAATQRLGTLLSHHSSAAAAAVAAAATVPSSSATKGPAPPRWIISSLLGQLYDVSTQVRELAAGIVQEACDSPAVLEAVVGMRPALDHLGETGHPLLLRFLSTSVGFRYMLQGDYIDRAVDAWFHERNHSWVVHVEVLLAGALGMGAAGQAAAPVAIPPHFYGELTKTPEGCAILARKGHFSEFARFLRRHGLEDDDGEVLAKLKSVLWAVANVGSTPRGFSFLEEEDLVGLMIRIAERSPVLTVKGTAFFALGLVASTRYGAEALADHGWRTVMTTLGVPLSLCVPEDIDRFLSIPTWQPQASAELSYLDLAPPEPGPQRSIMTAVANLGNSIIANKASRTLARLKSRRRTHFADPALFARAWELLGSHHFRQPVRRYIWELFEVRLDERVVEQLRAARERLVAQKVRARQNGVGQQSTSKSPRHARQLSAGGVAGAMLLSNAAADADEGEGHGDVYADSDEDDGVDEDAEGNGAGMLVVGSRRRRGSADVSDDEDEGRGGFASDARSERRRSRRPGADEDPEDEDEDDEDDDAIVGQRQGPPKLAPEPQRRLVGGFQPLLEAVGVN